MDIDSDPQTYAIIGAAFEVHNQLGSGFLEVVYQEALAQEFNLRGIPYNREQPIPITYKGELLATVYRADFVCFNEILVELKALKTLSVFEETQVIHYLKATGLKRALLLNFGTPKLFHRRFVQNYTELP